MAILGHKWSYKQEKMVIKAGDKNGLNKNQTSFIFPFISAFLHTNFIKKVITMLLLTNMFQYFTPEK